MLSTNALSQGTQAQQVFQLLYFQDLQKDLQISKTNLKLYGGLNYPSISIGILGTKFRQNITNDLDRTTDGIWYQYTNIKGLGVHLFDCEGFVSDSLVSDLEEAYKNNEDKAQERINDGAAKIVYYMVNTCNVILVLVKYDDPIDQMFKILGKGQFTSDFIQQLYFVVRGSKDESGRKNFIKKIQKFAGKLQNASDMSNQNWELKCLFVQEYQSVSQNKDQNIYCDQVRKAINPWILLQQYGGNQPQQPLIDKIKLNLSIIPQITSFSLQNISNR
eukprot:403341231